MGIKLLEVTFDDYKDGIEKFYENVMKRFGTKLAPNDKYDCTKIDISKNIQDYWFDYYEGQGASSCDVAMMLLMMGPKVDESLSDNKVFLYPGFIVRGENGRRR